MPPRSPEIPTYFERVVLGKISDCIPIEKDVPAMRKTVGKLLAKGWIERFDNSMLALTGEGKKAFKAKFH